MGMKIDRTGEEGYNNFGSKMIIKRYRGVYDCDIYFPEYNWTAGEVVYDAFKKGAVKCPYELRLFNKGYFGEGKYNPDEFSMYKVCYDKWRGMLTRCYDDEFQQEHLTYNGVTVYESWLNLQEYGKWFEDNYYEVNDELMDLDKDIKSGESKIYSPDTCIFIPHRLNVAFIGEKIRNKKPKINYKIHVSQGIIWVRAKNKYRCIQGFEGKEKTKYKGNYDTHEEAFKIYKECKEKYLRELTNTYKDKLPDDVYKALMRYEIPVPEFIDMQEEYYKCPFKYYDPN